MIQPEAYYAAHKDVETPEELGRIGFIIVGREEELNPPPTSLERSFAKTILRCNKWHNEKREEVQEKWRKSKKAQRQMSKGQADVHECPKDIEGQGDVHDIYLPTDLSTYLPKTDTNRSEPDKGVKGEILRDLKAASGSDRVRVNVYAMKGEEFFSGEYTAIQLCQAALGNGFWAKAIRQLGDTAVMEELWAFVSEVRAGESVDNPGAVMTKRLKAKGVK